MSRDFSLVADALRTVAKNLTDAAKRVERHAADLEKSGDVSDIGGILNELLWLTPNLGMQTVIQRAIRELQKSA